MLKESTGFRNAKLDTASVKTIFSNGVIAVYTGAQPATADAAATGTLLGYITLNGDPFTPGSPANGLNFAAAAAGGVLSKAAAENWRLKGSAAGTAGWGRLMGNALDDGSASTTLPRIDFSIGTSGADMNLSNTTIAVGSITTIDQFDYSIPAQA